MPTFIPVTLEGMNYASVVFIGIVAISAVWYWVWGYRNYAGPPATEVDMHTEYLDMSNVAEKATALP